MKTLVQLAISACLVVAASFAFVGCSSTKGKADWNSRVGYFTYDQAVEELGPPDKQASLTDGGIVAEWITRRSGGSSVGFGLGGGSWGGSSGTAAGVGVSQSLGGPPDKVLRLTFGPDMKLVSWARN
ncbi:MAG TPA: hypothetical protein PKA41_02855 [Verrucomicrobiota bacterium]|nr:hypothetical protein [Verrucomicrobiota bacterium]